MALFVQLRFRRWSIEGHQPSRPSRAESDHCLAATGEGLRSLRLFHPRLNDTRSQIRMNRSLCRNTPTRHVPPPLSDPLFGWYWADISRIPGSILGVTAVHRLGRTRQSTANSRPRATPVIEIDCRVVDMWWPVATQWFMRGQKVGQLGDRDDMYLGRENPLGEDVVHLGVGIGAGVGEYEHVVVVVGGFPDGGEDHAAGADAGEDQGGGSRSWSCWSRSVARTPRRVFCGR